MTEQQDTKDFDVWLAELRAVVNSDVVISRPQPWTILDHVALSDVTIEILRAAHFLVAMAQVCYEVAQAGSPLLRVDFDSAANELLWLIDGLVGVSNDN